MDLPTGGGVESELVQRKVVQAGRVQCGILNHAWVGFLTSPSATLGKDDTLVSTCPKRAYSCFSNVVLD